MICSRAARRNTTRILRRTKIISVYFVDGKCENRSYLEPPPWPPPEKPPPPPREELPPLVLAEAIELDRLLDIPIALCILDMLDITDEAC